MRNLAVNWHVMKPVCSSCMSCRNDSLRADAIMILEPFMLPIKSISIICMFVQVWQPFICLDDSMKLSSLNGICLCQFPVSVSYAYKLYSFTKLGVILLIPNNTPSSWMAFLNLICHCISTRCTQPIVCCLYLGSECIGWSDLTGLLEDQHVKTIDMERYFYICHSHRIWGMKFNLAGHVRMHGSKSGNTWGCTLAWAPAFNSG